MRKEDCINIFERIPEVLHSQSNLVLKNAVVLAIDTLARFEDTYVVLRGREGGTTDEGRSFFVCYDDIAYIKIERVLKIGDLKKMYGDGGSATEIDTRSEDEQLNGPAKIESIAIDVTTPMPTPAPILDPAAIAKQNLLDRIRAARTNTLSGSRGK